MKQLKVGDTAEVIEVLTINKFFSGTNPFRIGSTGTIHESVIPFGIKAFVGATSPGKGWLLYFGEYRKVGRLTITKLK